MSFTVTTNLEPTPRAQSPTVERKKDMKFSPAVVKLVESLEPQEVGALNTLIEVLMKESFKRRNSLKFLNEQILICPLTKEKQVITKTETDGNDANILVIETKGKTTAWRHKITSEEI